MKKRDNFLAYLIILFILAADRWTKIWAANALADGPMVIIDRWLTFHLTMNRGVAFGMFQGSAKVVGWLTVLIVVGMFVYLHLLPAPERLTRLGLGLMIGGALGNMIDRLATGEVVDFIATPLRSGVFNIADVAVNVGVVVVILGSWWHGRSQTQPQPATPETEEI